jgi:hypothetical protein
MRTKANDIIFGTPFDTVSYNDLIPKIIQTLIIHTRQC